MEPAGAAPIENTPLNRLFFAINHYVSTGEHIGEGIALEGADGRVRVFIPVNQLMPQDQTDYVAFESRMSELSGVFQIRLEDDGRSGVMNVYSFEVDEADMDRLASALRERPGAAGWGSLKKVIDQGKWVV